MPHFENFQNYESYAFNTQGFYQLFINNGIDKYSWSLELREKETGSKVPWITFTLQDEHLSWTSSSAPQGENHIELLLIINDTELSKVSTDIYDLTIFINHPPQIKHSDLFERS